MPEERRTVTVLFADIVGSTELVERLDPEDVRTLQQAYFGTVAGVLRRWNGVVEKYIGDAVMALFGVPGADGFDAYRAVRAGLEIQEALDRRTPAGTRLRVRVGVATGEVLVDLAATRDGGHGTASGAVITAAARLQEYAPPGGVVVCAATRRATAGLLDLRPLAALTVAGRTVPPDVWRVIGPARPRPIRHRGPLVGRRRELATAGDEIARAVRERRPRWVSLVGPAGSGRSRLLHELTRAVSTVDGVPVRWCVAHCPPYPQGELAPLADMVRAFAGVRDTDPAPTVRRRLAAALDGLLPPARRAAAAHALAEFVAAPPEEGAAARGAEVWREVLLDLAAGRPVVVAVDDLDRAAPPLNRFLHRLFAAATERKLPLAVVATHGPGWADLLPGAADRRRRVPLPALGSVETGRLLRHLLGRAGRPAALAGELLSLVGGNPAAARAYVAALDHDGPPDGVPEPVRRMVDVRLDRLDGAQRAVLMAAAHHGAAVDAGTAQRLLDWPAGRAEPVLRSLAGAGLLRRTAADRYLVAEPVVARVARHRLPRALGAEFTRRLPSPVTRPVDPGPADVPARPALAGRAAASRTGSPAARLTATAPRNHHRVARPTVADPHGDPTAAPTLTAPDGGPAAAPVWSTTSSTTAAGTVVGPHGARAAGTTVAGRGTGGRTHHPAVASPRRPADAGGTALPAKPTASRVPVDRSGDRPAAATAWDGRAAVVPIGERTEPVGGRPPTARPPRRSGMPGREPAGEWASGRDRTGGVAGTPALAA
ncbi:adenylate/guanylate cyclase domain-containing protein [Micromonospora soli]|uniref:AAA family ATPase n=1 Tax=Micromonospora sp. NBRC 110009 TaxID=3061627 RepID=UPI002673FEA7|nr:adenylate/guanylate cyclase domain-containing protein [Micromonospora sp. NBRC 110009]WKT97169.1 adenylate/guanylate cyclase domain-containing protein [Micromonospora sp. NBRC 110009]